MVKSCTFYGHRVLCWGLTVEECALLCPYLVGSSLCLLGKTSSLVGKSALWNIRWSLFLSWNYLDQRCSLQWYCIWFPLIKTRGGWWYQKKTEIERVCPPEPSKAMARIKTFNSSIYQLMWFRDGQIFGLKWFILLSETKLTNIYT